MRRISVLTLLLVLAVATPGIAAPGDDDPPNPVKRLVKIIKHVVLVPFDGLISVPKP
jgi:hypothetical protein